MTLFSHNLRAWRLYRGWTQKELAHQSGIPRANLVFLEKGKRECTLSTLYRLAYALGISPGMVLDMPPPTRLPQHLNRHEVDQIARNLLSSKKPPLPFHLATIRDQVAAEAAPLLTALGLQQKRKKASRQVLKINPLLQQVLKRLSKLAPSFLHGVPL